MKGAAECSEKGYDMNSKTLKQIARIGLIKRYGFAPIASEIHLLESDDSGNYIMVRIGSHEYQIRRHLEKYTTPLTVGAEYVYEVEEYRK